MVKIRKAVRGADPKGKPLSWYYLFVCPGCNCEHAFDDRWKFNHDFEKPTISPSFKQEGFLGFKDDEPFYGICHSFIKDGKIQFLNDCAHDLKGKTVDLPDIKPLNENTDEKSGNSM